MTNEVKYPAGKVYFGSDESSYDLKDKIKILIEGKDYLVIDLGAFDIEEVVDYGVLAREVAEKVLENEDSCDIDEPVSGLHGCKTIGIIIGSSGVGLLTAVNSLSGVQASLCSTVEMAANAKSKNMNILCVGMDSVDAELAEQIIIEFLS